MKTKAKSPVKRPPFNPTVLAGTLVSAPSLREELERQERLRDKESASPCNVDSPTQICSSKQEAQARRTRLADLDANFGCSIIGTCLRTTELRKLVAKFKNLGGHAATDLEVHHAAVELAVEAGAGAKALTKLLDDRYAPVIQRFRSAKSAESVSALWAEAMKAGEIAGAYWSVMTHPCSTPELRKRAFGDVHMLSHLVGAANRADIRQLVALERENAELKEKTERQQSRLREINVQHQEIVQQLTNKVLNLACRLHIESEDDAGFAGELSALRNAVQDKQREASLHASRREEAERSLAVYREQMRRLQAKYDQAMVLVSELQVELGAMERQFEDAPKLHTGTSGLGAMAGRRLVYVGGRPSSTVAIRNLCERAGIDLTVHDGGIEDRKGLLAAAVPGAALVLFPVDCVDHDSVGTLKRLCQRHGVNFVPLRSAGVASFVSALTTHAVDSTMAGGPPASRFCLRHG